MDNLKKNRSSRQKKNYKMIEATDQELKSRLNDPNIKLESHQNAWKYSEVFHEFMNPMINEVIDDENLLNQVLDWGQLVWNMAVALDFPDNPKSKNIESLFALFIGTHSDKLLISQLLNRKKELFGNYHFFIVQQTSLLEEDGRLAISVAVQDLDE
jgi:hypothetical protein